MYSTEADCKTNSYFKRVRIHVFVVIGKYSIRYNGLQHTAIDFVSDVTVFVYIVQNNESFVSVQYRCVC